MAVRILIADDHGVMRAGLRALLEDEPGIEVVGEAARGEDVIRLAGEQLPDIVLTDIGMPGITGIEVTRRIKSTYPQIQVLILTVYEDESLLREAFSAGASGYVIKRALEDELMDAIKVVGRGDMYIHPAMTRLLMKDFSLKLNPEKAALDSLTPREKVVMDYIIRGYTNRQIAEELTISMRTVEGHRANVMGKLGLKNRVELVEFAERHGLKK